MSSESTTSIGTKGKSSSSMGTGYFTAAADCDTDAPHVTREPYISHMPLVKEMDVCRVLVAFCGDSTRKSLAKVCPQMKQCVMEAELSQILDEVYGRWRLGHEWKPAAFDLNLRQPRYLWSDAFGVLNYLNLFDWTKNARFLQQSKLLVAAVHNTLGKSRDGSKWLAGASEEHPTLGGLRIGKKHAEDHADGDGQYFHYLTKWMFALNRMTLVTKEPKYNRWAVEMAEAVFPHFVVFTSSRPRMFWKLSIDLSKPMVRSEGNLDPFDGFVTYRTLQETAGGDTLRKEIEVFGGMVQLKIGHFVSSDPLDLGESLWLAHWYAAEPWAQRMIQVALRGAQKALDRLKRAPARRRLAFREFGAALGLKCAQHVESEIQSPATRALAEELCQRVPGELLAAWRKRGLRTRDNDITPLMYCAAEAPGHWLKPRI